MTEQTQLIINTVCKYHYVDTARNKNTISEADNILRSYIRNNALSQEKYTFVTSLALNVADKRFDSDTVAAAMLSIISRIDFEEKLSKNITFKNPACRVLDILKSFHDFETNLDHLYQKQKYIKKGSNSETGFLDDIDPQVLAIKTAKQMQYLSNENIDIEDKLNAAEYTRNFYVHQLQNIGAYKDSDILLEQCFRLENNSAYKILESKIDQYKRLKYELHRSTLLKLKKLFDPNNRIVPEALKPFQKHLKGFTYSDRTLYSIFRSISKDGAKSITDLEKMSLGNEIAYYDCTLVLKDSDEKFSDIDLFFSYYNNVMSEESIYLIDYSRTTYEDTAYFILCDEMDCKYRLFIRKETEYLHYLFGDILEKDKISLNNPNQEQSIHVFKKDGAVETILAGATALDLAFSIHGNLGLCFDYALINDNPTHRSPYTVLNKGDTVEIIKKDTITANLKWIRYVKTDIAKYHLYRYFREVFRHLQKETSVEVITKDNTTQTLKQGATVLDLAFSIHQDLGLHFSYALINDKKAHMPAYTPLRNGSKIVICTSKSVTPELQWFRYVKTDLGTRSLIKYFQKQEKNNIPLNN